MNDEWAKFELELGRELMAMTTRRPRRRRAAMAAVIGAGVLTGASSWQLTTPTPSTSTPRQTSRMWIA